jgi:hypothetical protein
MHPDTFYPEDYFEPEKEPAKVVPIKKSWVDKIIAWVQKLLR